MIDWYGKVLEKLNGIKDNNNICICGTATGVTEGRYIKSLEFYDLLNKTGRTNNCNNYAFHNYDSRTLKKIINEHYNKLNTYGGFNYINITEYGSSSADIGEQKQAEDNVKQTIETNVDINAILFDSQFFEIYAIGTSKGLQIRKIKGGTKPVFEDKAGACLSLAYNKDKSYLFAGFADGTIRVYKTSNNGEN